jgi:hypothetical protein
MAILQVALLSIQLHKFVRHVGITDSRNFKSMILW